MLEPVAVGDQQKSNCSEAAGVHSGMPAPTHLTIKRFEQRAAGMGQEWRQQGLEDTIAELARWMDGAHIRLNDEDRAELVEIGGALCHEARRRRMGA